MGIYLGRRAAPDVEVVGLVPRSRWLDPPRLRTAEEGDERRATRLELFFDLVVVVAITELSHQLVLDHSTEGFLRFAGLFVPVFVACQGVLDLRRPVRHGRRAPARSPLDHARAQCARVARRPGGSTLTRFNGIGYGVGVAIWLASLAFDPPARYVVSGVALAVELSLPPLTIRIRWRVPTSASHVPERCALFTLIVLGESVVAVALSTAGSVERLESASTAVLGFAAVDRHRWLHFDRQASVVLAPRLCVALISSYAHLPLLPGLAALSAGLRLVIDLAERDHLGSVPASRASAAQRSSACP
jgi:low temperature requirement protein LtrA